MDKSFKKFDCLVYNWWVSEIIDSAIEVFEIEANAVLNLRERVGDGFIKAVDILFASKGKVIVTGMGKSGHIGRKIAATLSSTGTPALFLHPAESTHGDSGIIARDDVVIAISNSGETSELLGLLPIIERFHIPLIALCGKVNSPLCHKSDVTLDISVEKEACPLGKAPTASCAATLAMGDALAVCLLKKRGFTYEDFALYHPSGALGKSALYKVEELMVKCADLPIILEDTDFKAAVAEITTKKLGVALVMGKNGVLAGILTDGDIRRAVLKYSSIDNLKAKDTMTKNPRSIGTTELCARAIGIMEKYSITSLVVVDEQKAPVGLVHIHDLLKAGIV
jgi:arabinose-5-phosphate isomerase